MFVLELQWDNPKVLCGIFKNPGMVHEDNQGVIALIVDPQIWPCTKHIAIKYHHFRSFFAKGDVVIKHIDTKGIISDILWSHCTLSCLYIYAKILIVVVKRHPYSWWIMMIHMWSRYLTNIQEESVKTKAQYNEFMIKADWWFTITNIGKNMNKHLKGGENIYIEYVWKVFIIRLNRIKRGGVVFFSKLIIFIFIISNHCRSSKEGSLFPIQDNCV